MKFEMSNKPQSIFSFSSLTDIVMLLLIFFLITSQFVVQTGVKVKLPGSKNNTQQSTTKLIVSIDKNNEIYLGAEKVTLNLLPGKMAAFIEKNKEKNLILKADKTVSIDLVVKVMDAAKGVGIKKIIIGTEKESF